MICGLVCVGQMRWMFVPYQSARYLGVAEEHSSKQNSSISRFSAYLPVFSLFFWLLSLLRLRPASPSQPVAELQQRLGKADCGIPGKPPRAQSEGWGRAAGSFQLSAVTPLLGFSFKEECMCVTIYFFPAILLVDCVAGLPNSLSRKEKGIMWGRFQQSRRKQCTG